MTGGRVSGSPPPSSCISSGWGRSPFECGRRGGGRLGGSAGGGEGDGDEEGDGTGEGGGEGGRTRLSVRSPVFEMKVYQCHISHIMKSSVFITGNGNTQNMRTKI